MGYTIVIEAGNSLESYKKSSYNTEYQHSWQYFKYMCENYYHSYQAGTNEYVKEKSNIGYKAFTGPY